MTNSKENHHYEEGSIMRLFLTALLVTFNFSGCKSEDSSSNLQHTWGDNELINYQPLKDCYSSHVNAPLANEYLRIMMEDMMAASPVTFSGRFAPDKFCISIKDDSSSNASAVMEYRSIFLISV